jgi:hypothetical protein
MQNSRTLHSYLQSRPKKRIQRHEAEHLLSFESVIDAGRLILLTELNTEIDTLRKTKVP